MLRMKWMIAALVGAWLAMGAAPAAALSSAPALPSGFGADDGTTLWSPGSTSLLAVELYQPLGVDATFGFFFESDPSHLVPIFGPAMVGSVGYVHLNWGVVQNGAYVVPGSSFDPAPYYAGDGIGFYLAIENGDSTTVLHTLPGLNDGVVDAATTHPDGTGTSYVIAFQRDGEVVQMDLIGGVTSYATQFPEEGSNPLPQGDPGDDTPTVPVPEPSSWLLFGLGLALAIGAVERRSSRVTSKI